MVMITVKMKKNWFPYYSRRPVPTRRAVGAAPEPLSVEDSTDDGSSSDDDSSAISLLERINSTSTCVVSFQVCYRDFTRRSHFEKFVQAFGSQNTLNIEHQIKKKSRQRWWNFGLKYVDRKHWHFKMCLLQLIDWLIDWLIDRLTESRYSLLVMFDCKKERKKKTI